MIRTLPETTGRNLIRKNKLDFFLTGIKLLFRIYI